MKKRHYTYIIKNLVTNQIYIGVRSCTGNPKDDNYWSSSTYVKQQIAIYGKGCFRKRVLMEHRDRESALDHEIMIHADYRVNKNSRFMNRARQTSSGFDTAGRIPHNKGIPRTAEQKRKQSESMLGKPAHNKGIPMAPEQKYKLSDTWEVITPNDETIVINNMREFCILHNLNPSAMSSVARGRRGSHRNYKCKKITNNRNVEYKYKEWKSKGHQSKARYGSDNGCAKRVKIDGTVYDCMREASEKTGLSLYKIRKLGIIL